MTRRLLCAAGPPGCSRQTALPGRPSALPGRLHTRSRWPSRAPAGQQWESTSRLGAAAGVATPGGGLHHRTDPIAGQQQTEKELPLPTSPGSLTWLSLARASPAAAAPAVVAGGGTAGAERHQDRPLQGQEGRRSDRGLSAGAMAGFWHHTRAPSPPLPGWCRHLAGLLGLPLGVGAPGRSAGRRECRDSARRG